MKTDERLYCSEITTNIRAQIEEICKSIKNPGIKSFYGYWTRFKNWDKFPPAVLLIDDKVVAFVGFTASKRLSYTNLYAIATTNKRQNNGYATILFEYLLAYSHNNNINRLKCSAHESYPGYQFFTKHLNWKPIAKIGNEYKFDSNIRCITNILDFKERINKQSNIHEIPEVYLKKYKEDKDFLAKFKSWW